MWNAVWGRSSTKYPAHLLEFLEESLEESTAPYWGVKSKIIKTMSPRAIILYVCLVQLTRCHRNAAGLLPKELWVQFSGWPDWGVVACSSSYTSGASVYVPFIGSFICSIVYGMNEEGEEALQ